MRRQFDQCGGDIIAAFAMIGFDTPAARDRGTRRLGFGQRLVHHLEGLPVDQRADQHAVAARIADLDRTIDLAQFRQELIVNALMHKQPPQGGAALSGCADRRKGNAAQGQIEIGRGGDDGGIVAAQFQNGAGETGRQLRGNLPSHRGRAGGRDQCDAVVIDQSLADLAASHQHSGDSLRQTAEFGCRALDNRLRGQSREQCFFRRLPDHRIAADQCQSRIP